MVLVLLYFFAEAIGGWWTGSLALLADAGHMFSDLAALGISLGAAWLNSRPASGQRTFGYRRAEIIAALINGALLFLVAGAIVRESWDRWWNPHVILAGPMLLITMGGLIINLISLQVLHGDHDHNLNLRAAWLHVVGDTLGSIAVIVAAILVWLWNWTWADPVASVLVCVIVLYSAGQLVWEAVQILMEYAPPDISVDKVREYLMSLDGVHSVHCLHVWTIASGLRSMSAHVVIEEDRLQPITLDQLHQSLAEQFPSLHLTLQLEPVAFPHCGQEHTADHRVSG